MSSWKVRAPIDAKNQQSPKWKHSHSFEWHRGAGQKEKQEMQIDGE